MVKDFSHLTIATDQKRQLSLGQPADCSANHVFVKDQLPISQSSAPLGKVCQSSIGAAMCFRVDLVQRSACQDCILPQNLLQQGKSFGNIYIVCRRLYYSHSYFETMVANNQCVAISGVQEFAVLYDWMVSADTRPSMLLKDAVETPLLACLGPLDCLTVLYHCLAEGLNLVSGHRHHHWTVIRRPKAFTFVILLDKRFTEAGYSVEGGCCLMYGWRKAKAAEQQSQADPGRM